MQDVLVAVTVIVVGLLVGVELAVAAVANPIFDRLPGDSGLVARSSAARMLGRVMPFWYVGSVVLAGLWAAEMWGSALASIVMAAAALLLTSVVMSVVLLVPINSRVARWSRGAPPTNWRTQVGRWDRLHYVRVGIIVAAFALLVVAGVTT